MYSHGEAAADHVRASRAAWAASAALGAWSWPADAIRGVALGVGVTALVQSLLGGLGLALAGVPFAGLLTALMFMLCIAQIGPRRCCCRRWAGSTGRQHRAGASFWLVWTVVGTLDNVLRPVLIRMGADLPLLLIFAGVIGGLLAFGLVGIFVGPVVLAVGYTLLEAWMDDASQAALSGSTPAGAQASRWRSRRAVPKPARPSAWPCCCQSIDAQRSTGIEAHPARPTTRSAAARRTTADRRRSICVRACDRGITNARRISSHCPRAPS
jgi:energy-converting hydrogenase Eha subunit A